MEGEISMPAELLFIIVLLLGAGLVFVGKKLKEKIRVTLILLGAIMILIGLFGLFTSVL